MQFDDRSRRSRPRGRARLVSKGRHSLLFVRRNRHPAVEHSFREKYPIIGEIRGKGLMVGFDSPSAEQVTPFQNEMAKHGVKTSLSTGPTVRYLPPLVISESDINFLLRAMEKSLMTLA